MDSDWDEGDVDIPVVVEDDARSRGAHLSAVVAVVSSRPQSRSFIRSLLQAWKLLGYTHSPIKRTSLFQEMFLFLFRLQSQLSQDTIIIIGSGFRVWLTLTVRGPLDAAPSSAHPPGIFSAPVF